MAGGFHRACCCGIISQWGGPCNAPSVIDVGGSPFHVVDVKRDCGPFENPFGHPNSIMLSYNDQESSLDIPFYDHLSVPWLPAGAEQPARQTGDPFSPVTKWWNGTLVTPAVIKLTLPSSVASVYPNSFLDDSCGGTPGLYFQYPEPDDGFVLHGLNPTYLRPGMDLAAISPSLTSCRNYDDYKPATCPPVNQGSFQRGDCYSQGRASFPGPLGATEGSMISDCGGYRFGPISAPASAPFVNRFSIYTDSEYSAIFGTISGFFDKDIWPYRYNLRYGIDIDCPEQLCIQDDQITDFCPAFYSFFSITYGYSVIRAFDYSTPPGQVLPQGEQTITIGVKFRLTLPVRRAPWSSDYSTVHLSWSRFIPYVTLPLLDVAGNWNIYTNTSGALSSNLFPGQLAAGSAKIGLIPWSGTMYGDTTPFGGSDTGFNINRADPEEYKGLHGLLTFLSPDGYPYDPGCNLPDLAGYQAYSKSFHRRVNHELENVGIQTPNFSAEISSIDQFIPVENWHGFSSAPPNLIIMPIRPGYKFTEEEPTDLPHSNPSIGGFQQCNLFPP